MFQPWEENINSFVALSNKHKVRMLMVDSEVSQVNNNSFLRWNVLSLEDLITSKIKANRPKDLLDIQQLREINKL
ncbi:hypothetical protein IWX84_002115 [Flavobacterium sp. CG_9.10]|uniref:DUF6036 family nucleotidyltransferase n=1 Tax=Flavobacterium sp. CG_9.10 TaxID=2787729 RepID=UPI0018CA2943|nr:DUF6036 family nucleotidyltransferase [Flavobacterium sp. CG_9.10]MBG6111231.1 hypothetical protein [Flavobacterium sp. CG_9.10]